MKFNYEIQAKTKDAIISFEYEKFTPKFVLDIFKELTSSKSSLKTYLETNDIPSGSQMYSVFEEVFKNGFEFVWGSYSSFKDEIKEAVENGFVIGYESEMVTINDYSPVIKSLELNIYNKVLSTDDIDNMKDVFLENFNNVSDFKNIKNIEIKINDAIEVEDIPLEFELNKKGISYYSNVVDEELIDEEKLIELNPSSLELPLASSEYWDGMKLPGKGAQQRYQNSSLLFIKDEVALSVIVKRHNVEVLTYKMWKGLVVTAAETFDTKHFIESKGYKYYQNLDADSLLKNFNLELLLGDLDLFIPIINDVMVRDSSLARDKMLLSKVLLNNEYEKLGFKIKEPILEAFIKKLSLDQAKIVLPKMIGEIQSTKSTAIIAKVFRTVPEVLTDTQRSNYEDEVRRQEAIEDEINIITGKITSSGIREKIKHLSGKDKKKYKFDKHFTKFLNKNIGHSKGDQKNNADTLGRLKQVWKLIEAYQSYKK